MPGPLLTVTVSESTHRGAIAGPLVIFGHGILELSLITALLLGMAPLLQRNDVFIFISLVGGSILLWMAFSMFRSLPGLSLEVAPKDGKGKNLVITGILFSLANPYWIIWWATIGLGYVIISMKFGFIGVAVFFTGHILADLLWYSAVSLFVSRGRKHISDRIYRGIIGICAVMLIFFGIYFGVSGIRYFM